MWRKPNIALNKLLTSTVRLERCKRLGRCKDKMSVWTRQNYME